jgi:hypothetical protein
MTNFIEKIGDLSTSNHDSEVDQKLAFGLYYKPKIYFS